jgi:hypothetical protein
LRILILKHIKVRKTTKQTTNPQVKIPQI